MEAVALPSPRVRYWKTTAITVNFYFILFYPKLHKPIFLPKSKKWDSLLWWRSRLCNYRSSLSSTIRALSGCISCNYQKMNNVKRKPKTILKISKWAGFNRYSKCHPWRITQEHKRKRKNGFEGGCFSLKLRFNIFKYRWDFLIIWIKSQMKSLAKFYKPVRLSVRQKNRKNVISAKCFRQNKDFLDCRDHLRTYKFIQHQVQF